MFLYLRSSLTQWIGKLEHDFTESSSIITKSQEGQRHQDKKTKGAMRKLMIQISLLPSLSRPNFLVRLSWCLVCCFIGGYLFSNIADWDLTISTILSTSKFSPEQNTGETKHLNHNIILQGGGPDTMEGSQKGRRITD